MPELWPIARARGFARRAALVSDARRYDFASLLHGSAGVARGILSGASDLSEARVAYLVPPGFAHVAVQWGIWQAGGVAVPLGASQAPAEHDYILGDSQAAIVIGGRLAPGQEASLRAQAERRGARYLGAAELLDTSRRATHLPDAAAGRAALILYTSGTTSRPKGVVWTHDGLAAQVTTLVSAWGWREDDRVLHVLPLNHVHGLVNVLACALWSGACCEFLAPFEARAVWERFAACDLTLFMAVPTMYARLVAAFDAADQATRARWAAGARAVRLMVSGSAALPVGLLERWRQISGQVLLERYGMTEIGMALSNPLDGPRRAGFVGVPLPGVQVRLVDEGGGEVAPGTPGEIEVRGPGLFREYWRQPDATRSAFRDGWFRTGDVAIVEEGSYRILGRRSVDIIKTGGFKVSALEIEEVLREHPQVADCAVVGLPDAEWGERVAAAIVRRSSTEDVTLDSLRSWAASRLARYKLPTRVALVPALPRNAMGKVTKGEVKQLFDPRNGPEGKS